MIQIAWISEFDPVKDKQLKVLTVIKNSEFLDNYVTKHNEFYNTNLTDVDLQNQIIADYVVGFGCGEAGIDVPKESRRMLKLTKRKNKRELNKYLTSFSPELQTLGAIGLLEINQLTDQQTKIINHLKSINPVIFSCSGCLYGLGETFNERLANF